MIFNLGNKESKEGWFSAAGSLVTTAAPWGELSPFPASLETCPCHGASGSLRSPVPNPTALQEPSGGHSPFAGRQHMPEKGSQQPPKSSGGSGEGRQPHRSRGAAPSLCPRDAHLPAHTIAAVSVPQQLRIFHSNTYLQYLPGLAI